MFPYFRTRGVDQQLLSCWLDNLDLSSRFHLDAFCLIQRYSFVDKLSWVDAVLSYNYDFVNPRNIFYVPLHKTFDVHKLSIDTLYAKYNKYWRVIKSVGSNMYILGWINVDRQILAYDMSKNSCGELPQMLFDHGRGQMEILNNLTSDKTLVLMGGSGEGGRNNLVEEYDFEEHEWRRLANMKTTRFCFASAVVEKNSAHQNHIVVAGAPDFTRHLGSLTTVEMYCKETNQWTSLKNLPFGKCLMFATIWKEKFVVGPTSWGGPRKLQGWERIDKFDFHKQEWTVVERNLGWNCVGYTHHAVGTTRAFTQNKRDYFGCRLVVTDKKYANVYDEKSNEWMTIKLCGDNHMFLCL